LVRAIEPQREERIGIAQRAEVAFKRAQAEAAAAKRQPLRLIAGVPDPWGSRAEDKQPEPPLTLEQLLVRRHPYLLKTYTSFYALSAGR
jgi:hypothetical protein